MSIDFNNYLHSCGVKTFDKDQLQTYQSLNLGENIQQRMLDIFVRFQQREGNTKEEEQGEVQDQLLESIKSIPKEERDVRLDMAISILQNCHYSSNGAECFLHCIGRAKSSDEIRQLISAIRSLLAKFEHDDYLEDVIVDIFEFLAGATLNEGMTDRMNLAEALAILEAAKPFVERAQSAEVIGTIFSDFIDCGNYNGEESVSGEHILEVFRAAQAFLPSIEDDQEIGPLFYFIFEMESGERESIVAESKRVLEGVKEGRSNFMWIFSTVNEIPSDSRKEIIDDSLPLLQKVPDAPRRSDILKITASIPSSEERRAVIAQVLAKEESEDEKVLTLRQIVEMPTQDMEKLLPAISELSKEVDHPMHIVSAVRKMPFGERMAIISVATLLFQHPFLDSDRAVYKARILDTIHKMPPGERVDIINDFQQFLKGKPDLSIEEVLPIVASIPSDQRKKILNMCHSLVENLNPEIKEDPNLYSECITCVLNFLTLVSPTCLEQVVEKMRDLPQEQLADATVLLHLVVSDPMVREETYQYWQELLNQEERNQSRDAFFAESITEYYPWFQLREDDPLVQKAIYIAHIASQDEEEVNPKNPYTLYHTLTEEQKKPLYRSTTTHRLPSIDCGVGREDKQVRFKWDAFQLATANPITVNDLPESIDSDTLEKLFHEMNKRIDALPLQERERVDAHITSITGGHTRRELTQNMLGQQIIARLLSSLKLIDSHQPIDPLLLKLCMIIKNIHDKRDERQEGEMLIPQEECLLQTANSITNCPGGQHYGISTTYSQLEPQYRLVGKVSETEDLPETTTKSAQAIREKILPTFHKVLEQLLTDPDLYQEILQAPIEQEQEAHDILFLRNRLSRHLGLIHQLAFDLNAECISDELVKANLDELMNALEKVYLQKIIPALKRDFMKTLKEEERLPFIRGCIGDTDIHECCHVDDDTFTIQGLTDYGALMILQSFGLIDKNILSQSPTMIPFDTGSDISQWQGTTEDTLRESSLASLYGLDTKG